MARHLRSQCCRWPADQPPKSPLSPENVPGWNANWATDRSTRAREKNILNREPRPFSPSCQGRTAEIQLATSWKVGSSVVPSATTSFLAESSRIKCRPFAPAKRDELQKSQLTENGGRLERRPERRIWSTGDLERSVGRSGAAGKKEELERARLGTSSEDLQSRPDVMRSGRRDSPHREEQ
ncbi:uncharacterized protein UTRI_02459 [Ustilago trichophora]|uniref:Uncharacterized protein n=1 Tax=Ustilago trichophora TaxID=86804 RepID=A0A5C3E658_9BASI|nr:uncharacterized protein UTRI_02459 [Ustilago trichophora]